MLWVQLQTLLLASLIRCVLAGVQLLARPLPPLPLALALALTLTAGSVSCGNHKLPPALSARKAMVRLGAMASAAGKEEPV